MVHVQRATGIALKERLTTFISMMMLGAILPRFSLRNVHMNYVFRRLCKTNFFQSVSCLHSSRNIDIWYEKHGTTVTETDVSEQERKPVVVLLGWNDSKDKHLQKYSDIFTKRNYGTVRVTARSFNTFFRPGTKVKQIGHNVLKVLDEMHGKERPVFLYSFSNGGCAMFFHIMEALTAPESEYFGQFNVVGSIFDSCPINTDMDSVKIVQQSVTENISNPVARGVVWYGLRMFVPLIILYNPTTKYFMKSMKQSSLMCNQLVLYSKADGFAPYVDIDDFIKVRRSLGVHVVAQCWETSRHVNHYREHPEEYLKLVNDFVHDCLLTVKEETFSSKL